MEAQKFRKKPVVIEAVQMANQRESWTDDEAEEMQEHHRDVARWIEENGGQVEDYGINFVEIETLEGTMTASLGDWIIRGVAGEFYPCKPEIFTATYEVAAP